MYIKLNQTDIEEALVSHAKRKLGLVNGEIIEFVEMQDHEGRSLDEDTVLAELYIER